MSSQAAARLGYLALYGAVGASFPYLSVYYAERGLPLQTIGLLTGMAAASGLLSAPVWGALADRFAGSVPVLPLAALIAAAGAALLAFASEPLTIALAVGLMSIAFAGIGPMLDARALELLHGDRNRWGAMRAWGSAAFIVVVLITGALIERLAAVSLFAIYVAMLVVLAVVTIPLRGSAAGIRLPHLSGIAVVLRHPPVARFLIAILLVWSASMSINWYFSIHLLALGAPGELVGSAWAIGALVEIPILSAYPWLAARFGGERLLVIGAGFFALRALAVALIGHPVLAASTMALHGAGFALVLVGGVTYVARHAPPATAATAQGVLSATVFSLALMIGPWVGSTTAEVAGVPEMFWLATIAGTIAVPILWSVVRTTPRAADLASRGSQEAVL